MDLRPTTEIHRAEHAHAEACCPKDQYLEHSLCIALLKESQAAHVAQELQAQKQQSGSHNIRPVARTTALLASACSRAKLSLT